MCFLAGSPLAQRVALMFNVNVAGGLSTVVGLTGSPSIAAFSRKLCCAQNGVILHKVCVIPFCTPPWIRLCRYQSITRSNALFPSSGIFTCKNIHLLLVDIAIFPNQNQHKISETGVINCGPWNSRSPMKILLNLAVQSWDLSQHGKVNNVIFHVPQLFVVHRHLGVSFQKRSVSAKYSFQAWKTSERVWSAVQSALGEAPQRVPFHTSFYGMKSFLDALWPSPPTLRNSRSCY